MERARPLPPLHDFPDPVALLVKRFLCRLEIMSVEAAFQEFQVLESSNLVPLELPS